MKIAIRTETGELHNLEVDSQIELENVKALIEAETGTPPTEQIISHKGQEMTDLKRTLEQYGVKQNETLYLRKRSPTEDKIRIAITTEMGDLHNLEVDSQIEFESIKPLIEAKTGIPSSEQTISYNGQEMTDPKRTLKQYGIVQDEILYLRRRSSAPMHVEQMRQALLNDPRMQHHLNQTQPELANAANDPIRFATLIQRMMQRQQEISLLNEENEETQRRIEEEIRMENVMANLDAAIESFPESFAQVTMLYIDVKVNNHPVKAFVDSGAQETIMSPQCAENCGIMRLVDTRFNGVAVGVGTAKILGKVHRFPIQVGEYFLECSFIIMEACIDLKKNALIINGNEIPFLPEHELPKKARIEEMNEDIRHEPSASSTGQSRYPEENINVLISMGISRVEAIKLLDATSGNVEMAASLYFG
ncbi:14124_t:CDS:10 [Acaulospora morrowiae]|uniref:DNA damage-inducible protein 1 n=1 Tax=Acaulospora morrowiae TaxID=94023 RepID=A0A9N9C6L7_9GLOM|nr:14124_t:CDS:10 [Acaulospora morrowiae]